MIKGIISLIQAFLFLVSSFSVTDSNFKRWVDLAALDISSEVDFGFDSITANEMKVSYPEKKLCRDWFNENILYADGTQNKPAYNFTVGGKSLQRNIDDWDFSLSEESEAGSVYKNGKTSYITLKHKLSGLVAEVEATIYEEYATCEWTVFIKNTADENSPVIKNFYGADCKIDTGKADLYVSKGSEPSANDFELHKSFINNIPMNFTANGGRTESFLPYFNICGKNFGAVLATGWTGQWFTSLEQKVSGVKFKVKQENFKAYLTPDEEVRSPLVSLSFYKNKNAVKGFNTFRNWEMNCVCPESIKPLNGFVIANEFSTLTCDELIDKVNSIDEKTMAGTDYFWMDAGWYKYNEGWHDGVGNWIPDKDRFPNGLKPLADAMAAKGKKFLLWYEPERVREDTVLYNEGMKHADWVVQFDDNTLWNLGSDEACDFLSKYISDSLVSNGVSMYRQDFNFSPLIYWEKADKEFYDNRTGICENHYVANLYKYLDNLCRSVDGLIIDNCASGGKRLDIEMTRRSLPLWRSDYNCGNADGTVKEDVLEATQAMTYGLSCWLPYSGTNRYFHSEYASRTAILTNQSYYDPDLNEFVKYSSVSNDMTKNYYPLTYGGLKTNKVLAMQFGDEMSGSAVIYKREKVKKDSYTLKLNGLDEDGNYTVWSIDAPEKTYTLNGSTLMSKGIELTIKDSPKAEIIKYELV